MPQGQNKPSKSGKKNPYFNPLKILRLPKTPKWKLGLGVAGVFLLLAILLFSREIGQLLDLIPTPAQKPGAPQITVTVEPFSQSGGPTDVRIYTLQTQIEHGTYFDAGNLEDPCNDICPLPFYGDIIYQVDDLVNQYPEFIESAVVTVPIENPEAFGNDPNQPRLTVLEDINTFGLFTNRRLSPEDLGFITTPPILTITLTDYALSEGGLTIPFEIQINANYLPSLGIHYVPPNDPPVMEDPDPAQGEIVLKGGLPPDFRVEVWERIEVSENVYECTDSKDIHAHWGENISYCVNVYSENDFEGWVDLSETDLAPYGGAEGEAGKYFVTPTPWIFPSSVYVTPDTPGTTKLLLVTQPDLMETVEFAPFPVYGTDTIVTREDYGNLYITPAISPTPDFTVEVSPTTHDNITWGSSADFIVYLASEEGFDGSIELSSLELANDWVDYVESYSFSEDIITLTPANDINNRVAVDLQIITRPVSYFEPDTPPTNQKVFFSVDGRDILGNIAYNPSKHSSYGEVTITYTIPLSDFYLEMEDPTGVEVQSSAGSAIYTIRVMREGYEGEIHLDALSWDTNHVGELLDSQTGINANLIETSTDDTWELTIAGDNTEFSRHYDFYIRGNALTPPPEEFRWAPNDEVNPYIQNSTPAYFRIQTTPGYDLEISSAQIISAGQVAEYTVRVTNPING
ncbi:MAG: hypothetical protein U9M89_00440, partial [Patescibacteria group bacterium]|nr:hypothetical protein [Patescibacteria group bacterium]